MTNLFVDGLALDKRVKWRAVLVLFIATIINHNLPVISNALNYAWKDYVSLGLLALMVIVSVGSKVSEGLVIGFAIFSIMSVSYDFSVFDISDMRRTMLLGSLIILVISIVIGKISVINAIGILKNQFGVGKKK